MGVRVLVGSSLMHGGGADAAEFEELLDAHRPDYVASDAGSCDPGAYYLGTGLPMTHREGLKQSLDAMLVGTRKRGIPVLIGSAGIAGRREQVDLFRNLISEIAQERSLPSFTLATIYADVPKHVIRTALADGRIAPLGPVAQLSNDGIETTDHVVAMMGAEPIVATHEQGPDVVDAGRWRDQALFEAFAMWQKAGTALEGQ